jgi:hypothetical protein
MERLRDRITTATAANRFSFKETAELPARFLSFVCSKLNGLSKALSLGREITAAGSVGLAGGFFSLVSLCDLPCGIRVTSAKATGDAGTSATPAKESSSFD